MSMLGDLIGKTKTFLAGRPQPVVRKATDAIEHDRFQAAMWEEVVADVPDVQRTIEDLNEQYDHTDDLVRDLGLAFWQTDPHVRPVDQMDPTRLANHAVVKAVQGLPEYQELKQYTTLDKYGAAIATAGIANKVREQLAKNKELAEAGEQAAAAQQQAQQAGDAAESAMAEAASAEAMAETAQEAADAAKPEGEGPLTEQGQQAQDAAAAASAAAAAAAQSLEAALAAAEAATGQSMDANAAVEAEAAKAAQAMNTPARAGVKEATAQLSEEAELFGAWGIEPGQLKMMSFKERAMLTRALRNSRVDAEMIGRFKTTRIGQKSQRVDFVREEPYDTELSGDLSRILGGELASLGADDDMLELMALTRFVEGGMVSKKMRGTEKIGHGAIIICVDNSGSMEGGREMWAKAFALALLDQAIQSKRDFVGINFSSSHQQSVHRFPANAPHNIVDIMRFTEEFFDGGTNFERPLDLATDILIEEFNGAGKKKGDIVFVTDDDYTISPSFTERFNARKEIAGFRVFGIAVGCGVGSSLASFSDNVRSITELVDADAVKDIFQVIQ